ncbi:A disintegrin and metalloproteinase with thrombospondin motifs adt-2-like [Saccostrea echinata]|uniref:A disintegrin and metalloproteinase with thrombospondin motifs adt-2-like n=1 Tax=Saccostrea echinata TaxID=191078 RepID=UPI002A840DD1|nr:A disintegrin and metalloproteinase with thrombospondin motifs adt-2-like [Saccostrea echinata]
MSSQDTTNHIPDELASEKFEESDSCFSGGLALFLLLVVAVYVTECSKSSKSAVQRCYTCSYGKKNSDCTKIETCKKDEESCETKIRRDKDEIKMKCRKTKDCKTKCLPNDKECTRCCTGDLCNKDQGYASFKAWGQWSSCSEPCGGGKRSRSRQCSSTNSIPCSGATKEDEDCNKQACTSTTVCVKDCKGRKNGDYQSCSTCNGFIKCSNSKLHNFKCPGSTVWDDKSKRCEWTSTTCNSKPALQRCYTCSHGKKNSDCTKIETCKNDEESCETKIRRDKGEIRKKCEKTKYCKPKCDAKDKECTMCCTGDLCNKDHGYAEFKAWGQWSSCSKQCGGGKRSRSRQCSSTGNLPCSGDTKEEQDCNKHTCPPKALQRCYTCSHGKKNSDCTKIETCKKDEESCETKIRRDKGEIRKKCEKTKDCKPKCDAKDKECTMCCTGDLCNKDHGYAEFKAWGQWSSCSKQCGGGKRSRSRQCSSTGNLPCSGDTKEEQDCNKHTCPPKALQRCYTCSHGKKNSDCTKIETCKKDEEVKLANTLKVERCP